MSHVGNHSQIREYTKDTLIHVYDTIAEGDAPKICEESISSKGGKVSHLLPAQGTRDDVVNEFMLGYTVTGEAFSYRNKDVPAKPQDFEFGKKFWDLSTKLIEAGRIKVHQPKVGKDGLVGVFDGMQQFREGKVSGVKLVYRVSETP